MNKQFFNTLKKLILLSHECSSIAQGEFEIKNLKEMENKILDRCEEVWFNLQNKKKNNTWGLSWCEEKYNEHTLK